MRLVSYVKPLVNICFSYGMCLFLQHYYPQEAPYRRDDRDWLRRSSSPSFGQGSSRAPPTHGSRYHPYE